MKWKKTRRDHRWTPVRSPWNPVNVVPFRRCFGPSLMTILLATFLGASSSCHAESSPVPFFQSGPAGAKGSGTVPAGMKGQRNRSQPPSRPHLAQWLRQHQNMSPQQQQRALRNEPGFNRLPPQRQQRLLDRLQQIDAMPPLQRERTLQRIEALERLSPQQRAQVHSAMQEVVSLPPQRQRMMHKAFRDLTHLPLDQREAALDSPQLKHQFSDRERQILTTLMRVQPNVPVNKPVVAEDAK
jgi:hypothetical protein